jgi:Lon protease-like protein
LLTRHTRDDDEINRSDRTTERRPRMTLPEVFPIFPLPQVILVPGQLLPLHVFEPRYREMVADAMDAEQWLAMAVPETGCSTGCDDEPAVLPVCGLGRIVHHQPYIDGRSDIVVEGVARMRILQELPTSKKYRLVRGLAVREDEPLNGEFGERCRGLLLRFHCFEPKERDLFARLPLPRLLDSLLLRLPVEADLRQAIFAIADLEERLEALECAFDGLECPPPSFGVDLGDPRLN